MAECDVFPPLDPHACAIIAQLRAAEHDAFLVGGCVRDILMHHAPKDWDIATSATPDEVEQLFDRTIPVGKSFGVIRVLFQDHEYEVATFRADSPEGDGRRPESVRFCSAKEDVQRRDFTINGLLLDPDSGVVVDYVGGKEDLAQGVIRAIGDPVTRFMEDHLRLLRAVRFAARFGFALEEKTKAAMRDMAGLARLVSAERLQQEMTAMLTGGKAGDAVRLLEETNLLLQLFPTLAVLRGMPQPPEFHPEGDVLTHTLIMLDDLKKGCEPALAWAVLLHDIGKPGTLEVCDRIRFSNHDRLGADMAEKVLSNLKCSRKLMDMVVSLVGEHMHLTALPNMREAKRRRWLQEPLFPLRLELMRLDCISSHGKMEIFDYAVQAYDMEKNRPPNAVPLLRGEDLIAMGFEPGPAFRVMLDQLVDAQLEGTVQTREEAVAFIRGLPEASTIVADKCDE